MSNVDRTKLNALVANLDAGKFADPELLQVVIEEVYSNLDIRPGNTEVLLKTNTTAFTPSADYHPSTKKYTNDEINAALATVLTKTNTTPYTPTTDYHPTTLKYVVDAINAAIVNVDGTAIIQTGTVFPATPTAGQSFFKTDENRLYVYSGTMWEGWVKRQQENWIAPTLLNGWVNRGSPYDDVAYFKDEFGVVHIKGAVKSGVVGANIFTVPVGYRPIGNLFFAVQSNSAFGMSSVAPTGGVSATVGANTVFSLDGITFRAEQ